MGGQRGRSDRVRDRTGGALRANARGRAGSSVGGVMSGLMQGKRGLMMGVANDHSIAWGIAKTLAAHGASLAFTYQGEALGRRVKPLAQSLGSSLMLPCDVENVPSIDSVFSALAEQWGSLDFLVH